MIFYTALLLLPSVACLFWVIVHSLIAPRVSTFRILVALLITVAFVIITDDSDLLFANTPGAGAICRLVLQVLGPSVMPLLMLYLDRVGRGNKFHPNQMAWIVAPAILFAAASVMTVMIGVPEIESFISTVRSSGHTVVHDEYAGTLLHAYYLSTKVALRVTVFMELAIYLAFIVYISKKRHLNFKRLFAGKGIPVLEAQVVFGTIALLSVMAGVLSPGNIIIHSKHIGAIWALLSMTFIFIFCYIALFGSKEMVSAENRKTAWRFNYSEKDKNSLIEQVAYDFAQNADDETIGRVLSRTDIASGIVSLKAAGRVATDPYFPAVSKSWDDPGLLSRFRHLMMDEQAFLEPGITVVDVAERLDSNKTYVSRMVNEVCNLTFPELLNQMRVDYAKKYLLSHRDANQNDIAQACGFISASSFNTTFKRITGYTPRVWTAREYELNPAS